MHKPPVRPAAPQTTSLVDHVKFARWSRRYELDTRPEKVYTGRWLIEHYKHGYGSWKIMANAIGVVVLLLT